MRQREKLLLVALDSKYIHSNLAVRYLKAYMKDVPMEIKIKEYTINDRIENILPNIMEENADIIAFSCYIWNIEIVKKLTKLIKLVDNDVEIIYGGPEVSYDAKNTLLNSPCDIVMEGEGEETFKEYIYNRINDINLPIKGLYKKNIDGIIYGGKRQLMNMENLVFPYDPEGLPDNKIIYYEASRGCPFSCKYCLSSTTHGVRFLPIERVKRELKFFIDNDINLVKFVDRTFNCNPKFAEEIWEYIISLDTACTFHFEISADILTENGIEILKKSPKGRIQFEIGVQTTNPKVLKNINRDADYNKIKKFSLKLKEHTTVKQHLDLIAGLPEEDFSSFRDSFNEIYLLSPEEIQLGFLKVLKGSPMEQEAKTYGIVYSPYPPYEVLKTSMLSFEEVQILKRVEEMVSKYNNSSKYNCLIHKLVDSFNNPFDFFLKLSIFYKDMQWDLASTSLFKSYTNLIYFNKKYDFIKEDLFKDLVKFEILNNNKNKILPEELKGNIAKEELSSIKEEILKKEKTDFKFYHIEKFSYDIRKYLKEDVILKKETYILFKQNTINQYILL